MSQAGAPTIAERTALTGQSSEDAIWTRASGRELALLGLYFALVVAATDFFNLRLGVELMTVVVAAAAFAVSRLGLLFLKDWWFLLVGLVLWNLSGPIAASSHFPAHLDLFLQADRALFLGRDPVWLVQHHLAHPGHVGPLDVVTGVAYNLHVPEPYIAGYFLWRLNRALYLQFAAAVLILLVLGFVTFMVLPAIPPWMAAARYGKLPGVYNGFGPFLRSIPFPFHGTPIFYEFKLRGDAIAAFPSEHAAFPMLEFLAFSRLAPRGALLFLPWITLVLFSVVYLGEHWVTDVIAGWLYAIGIFWLVRALSS